MKKKNYWTGESPVSWVLKLGLLYLPVDKVILFLSCLSNNTCRMCCK